jgi:hypothetical protein
MVPSPLFLLTQVAALLNADTCSIAEQLESLDDMKSDGGERLPRRCGLASQRGRCALLTR